MELIMSEQEKRDFTARVRSDNGNLPWEYVSTYVGAVNQDIIHTFCLPLAQDSYAQAQCSVSNGVTKLYAVYLENPRSDMRDILSLLKRLVRE